MIQKIEKESWFDYDVIIATPEMMPMLGKIGKLLGPKGLMPNPKTGTVTMDTAKAIEETKKVKLITELIVSEMYTESLVKQVLMMLN